MRERATANALKHELCWVAIVSPQEEGLDARWLRGQLGVVTQEPVVFGGSIRENIAYGGSSHLDGGVWCEPTEDEVEVAAATANAKAFIDALPDGTNRAAPAWWLLLPPHSAPE